MSRRKVEDSLANLGRAMGWLREALEVPRTSPLALEGTIQRFEFVIEIFWKAFKPRWNTKASSSRLQERVCNKPSPPVG